MVIVKIRRRQGRVVGIMALLLALGAALSACSSSPSASSSTSTPAASGGSSGGGAAVDSASSHYGTVLVSSSGRTLYMLSSDSSSASTCTGGCASVWPPLTTTGSPTAGSGVNASLLGTVTRSDGSKQVTYNGHPLYRYSGDTGSGQVNGEGINSFGGTWYVLDTSGHSVTGASSGSTTTTGYGGY